MSCQNDGIFKDTRNGEVTGGRGTGTVDDKHKWEGDIKMGKV